MTADRRQICVIASAHNDADSIGELARRLIQVFDQLPAYDWEAILVDNGSEDDTFGRIEVVLAHDPRFKVVQLARTFRHDGALSAGMAEAGADAVVLMHADLGDPPEMILEFVAQWETGVENVYAIESPERPSRAVSPRMVGSLSARLTGGLLPQGAGDFRLLDRRVYEQVRSMEERNRFLQGLVAWVGSRSSGVERRGDGGRPGLPDGRASDVASRRMRAVFAHSQVPMVLIPLVGIGLSALAFLTLVALSINWMINGVPFPGFGTIVALMVLLFGLLFCMLGVISIYVGLIYDETRGRPNFVIRRTIGFGVADRQQGAGTSANAVVQPTQPRPEGPVADEVRAPSSSGQ